LPKHGEDGLVNQLVGVLAPQEPNVREIHFPKRGGRFQMSSLASIKFSSNYRMAIFDGKKKNCFQFSALKYSMISPAPMFKIMV